MSMNESVAYLKGLVEGLDVDANSKEGKIFGAIIDALDEITGSVNDLQDVCDEQAELLDNIDEDLGSLEEDFYGDEDDEDDDDGDEGDMYEITCPKCGESICMDEDMLLAGDTECPNCGEKLEWDLDGCCCGDDSEDAHHD